MIPLGAHVSAHSAKGGPDAPLLWALHVVEPTALVHRISISLQSKGQICFLLSKTPGS